MTLLILLIGAYYMGLGIFLGYLFGWRAGYVQWRKCLEDQVLYGFSVQMNGKRIDPTKVLLKVHRD